MLETSPSERDNNMNNYANIYLLKCKELHLAGVIPAISIPANDNNFKSIKEISDKIIIHEGIDFFVLFLQEGHYLVQLWAAHILVMTTGISDNIKNQSLSVIKDYTDNPLVPEVSEAEKNWLTRFYPNA